MQIIGNLIDCESVHKILTRKAIHQDHITQNNVAEITVNVKAKLNI